LRHVGLSPRNAIDAAEVNAGVVLMTVAPTAPGTSFMP
jgi:hypothetical protein